MTDRPDDRGRTIYLAVLAAMVTSALTTWGLRALEGPTEAAAGGPVEVPSVLGLGADAASAVAAARGLRLVVTGREPSVDARPDEVVRQMPLAESQVAPGSAIEVLVSSGPPEVAVPDLAGTPLPEARAALEAAGLVVGDVVRDGEGAPNTVTATVPAAGEVVVAGHTIALTATPDGVVVPDLRGRSRGDAREALEAAGLEVGRIRYRYRPSEPELSVLDQDPVPETVVEPGAAVSLTLAE